MNVYSNISKLIQRNTTLTSVFRLVTLVIQSRRDWISVLTVVAGTTSPGLRGSDSSIEVRIRAYVYRHPKGDLSSGKSSGQTMSMKVVVCNGRLLPRIDCVHE